MSTPRTPKYIAKSLVRRFGNLFVAQLVSVDPKTIITMASGDSEPSPSTEYKLREAHSRLYGFKPLETLQSLKELNGTGETACFLGIHPSSMYKTLKHKRKLHSDTLHNLLAYWEKQKAIKEEAYRVRKLKQMKIYRDSKRNEK